MATVRLTYYPLSFQSPGPTRVSPTDLRVEDWTIGTYTPSISDPIWLTSGDPRGPIVQPRLVLEGDDLYAAPFPARGLNEPWTSADEYGGTVSSLSYVTSGAQRGTGVTKYTISDLDVPLTDLVGYEGNVMAFLLSGDDTIIGHDADDPATTQGGVYDGAETLYGLGGDDVLLGLSGNDTLVGGEGADRLVGGDGFDMASYATAESGVTVHTGDMATNTGDAAGDILEDIEGLIGSAHDDTLITTWSGGPAWGGAGNDVLVARGEVGATMLLQGEAGNDSLYGGLAMDELVGGEGDDIAFGYEGDDLLRLGSGDDYALGGTGNDVVLAGTGDDEAHGGAGDDVLVMGAGDDLAFGDAGNDLIELGAGNDFALGGYGADTFVFTSGHDRIGDFQHGSDRIEIDETLASSFTDVLATASEWEGTTYLIFSEQSGLILENTPLASLTEGDFLFV